MDLWERSRSVFWSEWFWLPRNVTWKYLENRPDLGLYYPQTSDLFVSLAVAALLYLVRQLYEKLIVRPFGLYCGIKTEKNRRAPNNEFLEKEYKKKKTPSFNEIEIHAKRTDMEIRQVERWYRLRRNQDRPTLMTRFTETGWRFTFYFGIFIYGLTTLWDNIMILICSLVKKIWFWESAYCWKDFPQHQVDTELYWYYQIELGFYLSLLFSQFLDVKRKDFAEMFVHHIATVSLLSFSYIANFLRVGSLVLCIHDCADFWVEGAKLAKYLQANRLCDILFAIFAIVWFVTRLVMYPLKILYTTAYESSSILGVWPSLFFFNGWMCLLLVLHIYWFSLIVKVAHSALTQKEEVDDVRSSTEEPVTEEDGTESNHVGNNVGNHVNRVANNANRVTNHTNHVGNHVNHTKTE